MSRFPKWRRSKSLEAVQYPEYALPCVRDGVVWSQYGESIGWFYGLDIIETWQMMGNEGWNCRGDGVWTGLYIVAAER